ncbi:MAG: 23S rRNA (adenine(2030)-N(6))-methyltransferase RlmJ [Treponemataceae bacterium]|nr:23S rRNA (adenine(2030)-N(6))-methyltransferase RlmJ [Treponemataceae bacterium]
MLSYRHAFHAGNHADILKHSMLVLILKSLQKKDKPYTLIDTHAGAGIYTLDDERAVKTGEAEAGIVRLLRCAGERPESVPEELLPYLDLCRAYEKDGRYPGSPEIMRNFLRPVAPAATGSAKSGTAPVSLAQDKLVLMELHNTEIDVLRINMKRGSDSSRINIHHRDAYAAMSALVPPEPKRGLLLMDPSYEVDSDYTNVIDSLRTAHRRWTSGVICLWYPLLKRRVAETAQLKAALRDAAAETPCSFMTAELVIDDEENEAGLYGSGMAVINPPWHLDDSMRKTLLYLASVLGVKKTGSDAASDAGFAPDGAQNASFGSWNVDMYAV